MELGLGNIRTQSHNTTVPTTVSKEYQTFKWLMKTCLNEPNVVRSIFVLWLAFSDEECGSGKAFSFCPSQVKGTPKRQRCLGHFWMWNSASKTPRGDRINPGCCLSQSKKCDTGILGLLSNLLLKSLANAMHFFSQSSQSFFCPVVMFRTKQMLTEEKAASILIQL